MARVTVEDCIEKIPNRFDLVLTASQRARGIMKGDLPTLDRDNDKNPVIALREIAAETVDLEGLGNFLESQIVEPLGRVNGVSEITFNGGGNKEMRIFIDPAKLTFYRITLTEVIDALRTSSSMMSVGSVTEGKRTYAVRAEAVNYTPDAAGKIVLRTDVSATGTLVPLLLSDIATIRLQSTQRSSYRRLNGEEAVIINALRAPGVNVVETMERLRAEIDVLNESVLDARDLDLRVVYDETKYILSLIHI